MARYHRAGRPSPKTRMVRSLPNTTPFHKASSRRYGAGTRPTETVSLQCRRSSPAAAPFHENPRTGNAERGAFLLRRRQPRYGLSDAAPDGPGNRPRLRYAQHPAPAPRQRDRPMSPRSTRQGRRAWQRGAGLALPDAGLSDANPDDADSQPRCTRRHPAGTEPLVIAAFRPPSALPEPP